ncbi:MAG TPA: hypothetical protein ENJ08_03550 [Gammaproteobacteria bacterium]|nr:hypothetical protein [Gammaproteobacteria bacterium]
MLLTHHKQLDYLDEIPDKLYIPLITHRYRRPDTEGLSNDIQQGLQCRCAAVLKIREFLVSERMLKQEDISGWLDEELSSRLYRQLMDSKLLHTTRHQPEVADELILGLLTALDEAYTAGAQSTGYGGVDLNLLRADDHLKNELALKISDAMRSLNRRYMLRRTVGEGVSDGVESFMDVKRLLDAHERIKSSKQLQSVIQLLGRTRPENISKSQGEGLSQRVSSGTDQFESLPDEHSLSSVTGICYGDDLCRMLPSELVLLGHARLKKLWHARRAESQLLNYHFRGVLSMHTPEFKDCRSVPDEKSSYSAKLNGPMILCVDTSASMQGKAEKVAKAIALEAMRVAGAENRQCYLYCFSDAHQITEYELNQNNGWQSLIDFLKLSFNGATDISAVLQKVSEKLECSHWSSADVLLVSDGRFSISPQVVNMYGTLHKKVRILGAQVSNWRSEKFDALCHQTFRLNNVLK